VVKKQRFPSLRKRIINRKVKINHSGKGLNRAKKLSS